MTPNAVARAVRTLANADRIEELPGTLGFFCPFSVTKEREEWVALRAKPPDFIESISIVLEGSDIPLTLGDAIDPGHVFMVTVKKRAAFGELRFFLSDALTDDNSSRVAAATLVRIAEMDANETFTTLQARYESWTVDAGAPYNASEPLDCSPQKLARDFTKDAATVVVDLRPWVLRTAPEVAGRSYACWKELASRRVLAALSNEVSTKDEATVYVFTGPPKRELHAPERFDDALSDQLQKAARWVYVEGRDPQARHILFSNELARAHEAQVLATVVARSLESADSGYNAHVKSGSRETLKALADLRKAVFEETQKISQRAQDLAGSLWKDVAIAAAPFVLKILPDAAKVPELMAVFPLAAAAFLIFSFSVQVYVNYRFFKHQDTTRVVWKRALALALSDTEINQLSEQPIQQSLRDYRKVRWAVLFVYLILVGILLKVGIDHLPENWWAWISQTCDSLLQALDRVSHWITRQIS